MTDSAIATIIAASVAAASALYATLANARTSRRLAALQVELNKQRDLAMEYMKAYISLQIEDRNRGFEAQKDFIRLIQILREKLRRVIEHPDTYSPAVLARELESLLNDISHLYASGQALFPHESDRELAHKLKNQAVKSGDLIVRYLSDRNSSLLKELASVQELLAAGQSELRNRARATAHSLIDQMRSHVNETEGARHERQLS